MPVLNIKGEMLEDFGRLGWPLRTEVKMAPTFADSLQTFLKVTAPAI